MESISSLSGLLATVWISIGIFVAAKFYPNYDHVNQFCSELGASGSPTEKLSPLINNYPLGFIFCLFGWHIVQLQNSNFALTTAGILIIVHGVGTWFAGVFPMDKDPYTKTPSISCKVHSWAGFIMLLALLIAPIIVAFSPDSEIIPFWFRIASLISVVMAVYFLVKMAKVVKNKKFVGLYQRISYWVKLAWLSALSIVLVQL